MESQLFFALYARQHARSQSHEPEKLAALPCCPVQFRDVLTRSVRQTKQVSSDRQTAAVVRPQHLRPVRPDVGRAQRAVLKRRGVDRSPRTMAVAGSSLPGRGAEGRGKEAPLTESHF